MMDLINQLIIFNCYCCNVQVVIDFVCFVKDGLGLRSSTLVSCLRRAGGRRGRVGSAAHSSENRQKRHRHQSVERNDDSTAGALHRHITALVLSDIFSLSNRFFQAWSVSRKSSSGRAASLRT